MSVDVEEYQTILSGLSSAKQQLFSLRVSAALEGAPAPEGSGHSNLLSFITRGTKGRDRLAGAALQRELFAAETQVSVMQGLLDDYTEREHADDTEIPLAADPE